MAKNCVRWSVALVALASTATTGWAQLPTFYKDLSGAVFVVKDLPLSLAGWSSVGLEQVKDHGHIALDIPAKRGARFASGRLGSFAIEILQPDPGDAVFDRFVQRHGDGVFAVVHTVPDQQALDSEIARLGQLGAGVLKTMQMEGARYTFLDTEAQGKYVLGLVFRPKAEAVTGTVKVTHLGLVIRDAAPVSAYWHKLGFPEMQVVDASPREDSRYHGKPLWFAFKVGWHSYAHPTFEWIIPPMDPPNCYADFLRVHGEGVQHIGIPVDNLENAVERYTQLGFPPVQLGAWGDVGKPNSGRYAYMDTEALGGISVELIHAIPK
jgi:catechol 2,3-dioxygenase-like lactoylglutathione lyase family enzyme